MQKERMLSCGVTLWIVTLIGILVGSVLTSTKDFKMYNTVEERRAAEQDQELRDSIDAEVKEALKRLALTAFLRS